MASHAMAQQLRSWWIYEIALMLQRPWYLCFFGVFWCRSCFWVDANTRGQWRVRVENSKLFNSFWSAKINLLLQIKKQIRNFSRNRRNRRSDIVDSFFLRSAWGIAADCDGAPKVGEMSKTRNDANDLCSIQNLEHLAAHVCYMLTAYRKKVFE